MSYNAAMFILIIAILIALVIISRLWAKAKEQGALRPFINKLIIGGFLALLVILALTGKLHWLGPVIGFVLLALKRLFFVAVRYFPIVAQFLNIGRSAFSKKQNRPHSPKMTTSEAYKTLGLQPGATKQEIIDAHRKLMQKLHPDRGGNDHLSAQINNAKEVLLESFAQRHK